MLCGKGFVTFAAFLLILYLKIKDTFENISDDSLTIQIYNYIVFVIL